MTVTAARSPRDQIAERVGRLVARIGEQYLPGGGRPPTPWAAASLARLRRAPADIETADLATLDLLYTAVGDLAGTGDLPNGAERAAYAALVLFAVHQHGHGERVHKQGAAFGAAASTLAWRSSKGPDQDEATVRRFKVIGASDDIRQVTYHLRQFIGLLRREPGIQVDYGRIARELYDVQRGPAYAHRVWRSWGIAFHRPQATEPGDEDQSGSETTDTRREQ